MVAPTHQAVVIEDDHDLSEMYGMTLRAAGFGVRVLRSGDDALVWFGENCPDLILLDLNLPKVSGIDILQYIRKEERLQKSKVVIVTANPEMAESVRSLADLVLIKPTSLSQIRDLARRLVS